MEYRFKCAKCNEEIVTIHLNPGESAKCKKCGGITKVPDLDFGVSNNFDQDEKNDLSQNTNLPKQNSLLLVLANITAILCCIVVVKHTHQRSFKFVMAIPVLYLPTLLFLSAALFKKERPWWSYTFVFIINLFVTDSYLDNLVKPLAVTMLSLFVWLIPVNIIVFLLYRIFLKAGVIKIESSVNKESNFARVGSVISMPFIIIVAVWGHKDFSFDYNMLIVYSFPFVILPLILVYTSKFIGESTRWYHYLTSNLPFISFIITGFFAFGSSDFNEHYLSVIYGIIILQLILIFLCYINALSNKDIKNNIHSFGKGD